MFWRAYSLKNDVVIYVAIQQMGLKMNRHNYNNVLGKPGHIYSNSKKWTCISSEARKFTFPGSFKYGQAMSLLRRRFGTYLIQAYLKEWIRARYVSTGDTYPSGSALIFVALFELGCLLEEYDRQLRRLIR